MLRNWNIMCSTYLLHQSANILSAERTSYFFTHYLKTSRRMGREFCRKLYWYPCSSWSFWAGSGSHGLCWDLFLTHLTDTAFLLLLHLSMKMRLRALLIKGMARSGPYIVFLLSQVDQMFSAWFHFYCTVCMNYVLCIFPAVTSKPHGPSNQEALEGDALLWNLYHECPGQSSGSHVAAPAKSKRLLWAVVCSPVNSQQGLLGIPSLSGAAHSEAGVTCASLSGRAKVESLKNHLLSLAFKLLAKHNALPRKACLLLTWKLIY